MKAQADERKGSYGYRCGPDAADKLLELRDAILLQYGAFKAKTILKSITSAIKDLSHNENKGPKAANMFGIGTDYRYIFVSKNYIFYRIEEDSIRIINLYHEKEDFMWQLFGIDTTPQETIEYWNE